MLVGRSGAQKSEFVQFLEIVFQAVIDVQVGNGRLNYINGYVSKEHDAVDVGLGEYVQKGNTSAWKATYRLLSKSAPCIPEVAIRMASHTEFARSYSQTLLYPPLPADLAAGRSTNFSAKAYHTYQRMNIDDLRVGKAVSQSFLVWHRGHQYDSNEQEVKVRDTDSRTRVRFPSV